MKQNTFSSLPASHQRLVRLMQRLGFGRIENLQIRVGLPVLDASPRVVRTLKLNGGRNDPCKQADAVDFVLKEQHMEFLRQIERLGDGVVDRIEVAHGLPVLIEIVGATIA